MPQLELLASIATFFSSIGVGPDVRDRVNVCLHLGSRSQMHLIFECLRGGFTLLRTTTDRGIEGELSEDSAEFNQQLRHYRRQPVYQGAVD